MFKYLTKHEPSNVNLRLLQWTSTKTHSIHVQRILKVLQNVFIYNIILMVQMEILYLWRNIYILIGNVQMLGKYSDIWVVEKEEIFLVGTRNRLGHGFCRTEIRRQLWITRWRSLAVLNSWSGIIDPKYLWSQKSLQAWYYTEFFHTVIYLILKALWIIYYYSVHFTDDDVESQRN